ncbi:DUF885 domain-containing protein [Caulobacter mirabilis]|nr:DUF885 domain-containing protein [Caulobacter mirabilis]
MRIVRRRFIQCAGAAGLIGLGTPVAARADDTLDGVVTEFMSTPPGLRSNAILYRKADEEFPDLSYEGSERAAAQARRWIARLSPLKSAPLDDDARDTLGVLLWELETSLGHHRYYWLDSPLSADGSAIEIGIGRLATAPLQTTADLDQYLARLEAFPAYVGQVETKVRGQESRRVLSHRETVIAEVGHLDRILAAPADAFVPATGRLSKIPAAAAARFQATARALTEGRVVPALRRLADYLRSDYLPRTNDAVGLWRLPEGADYYRFLLRSNVTLDLDPSDVHARTLETVAEADRDLAALRREIGFQGSAEAFHAELLTGARWKASSVEEVSDRFTAGLRRFDPVYARFFERPPSTPFGVEPQAPEYNDIMVNGRYRWPTDENPRGAYLFNGGDLANTSWIWATPLVLHELVPGHHLQIDRIYASRTLSPFRKSMKAGGPVEGWAEYGRRLAVEAGLYADDPMTRYANRLMDRRMAMMAAADTGMHAKEWSLSKALDYFAGNAITKPALQRRAMLGIATEYAGFLPSYWAGGAEYARLRRRAAAAKGAAFDLRRFHETILSAGILPFPVLGARLDRHFGAA